MPNLDPVLDYAFVEPWLAPLAPQTREAYRRDIAEFARFGHFTTPAMVANFDTAHDWHRLRPVSARRRFVAAWRAYIAAACAAGHIAPAWASAACSPLTFTECRFEPERVDFLFRNDGLDVRFARLIAITGMPLEFLVGLSPGHESARPQDRHWRHFEMGNSSLVRSWTIPAFLLPQTTEPDIPFFASNRRTPYSDSMRRLLLLSVGKALGTRAVGFCLRVNYVASAMRFGATRTNAILSAEGFSAIQHKDSVTRVSGFYCRRYFDTLGSLRSPSLAEAGFPS